MAEGVGEVEGMMEELGMDPHVASDLIGSVIRNDEGTEKEPRRGPEQQGVTNLPIRVPVVSSLV